jgi:F420-non-reducing hydrogenase large subunit
MGRRITIDPLTRLEGEGKVVILLDERGGVERAFFQTTDLRGFEKFCVGRPAEDLPMLTAKICGVCPTAHHIASSKALDDLYKVEPPPAARKIRELMLTAFIFEDHLLHFYFLGGGDILLDRNTPAETRNIFGVLEGLGRERGERLIHVRQQVRGLVGRIGGSPLFPVNGLPGGVAKSLTADDQGEAVRVGRLALDLARESLGLFQERVLAEQTFREWFFNPALIQNTYYLGLSDEERRVNFYDGRLRVVDPAGRELVSFPARDYALHLEERVESWTYSRLPYLKQVGWAGWQDGPESGIYRVGALGRLNAAEGLATPEAHREYERMCGALGGKPVHQTLAYHWARLIETLYAAERMRELAADPELTDPRVRTLPREEPREGIGVCEAPRGTLIHHYSTDSRGLVRQMNLLVATQNNMAALNLAVDRAARAFMGGGGEVSAGLLNRIETVCRAFDPCLGCSTHMLPGRPAWLIEVTPAKPKRTK